MILKYSKARSRNASGHTAACSWASGQRKEIGVSRSTDPPVSIAAVCQDGYWPRCRCRPSVQWWTGGKENWDGSFSNWEGTQTWGRGRREEGDSRDKDMLCPHTSSTQGRYRLCAAGCTNTWLKITLSAKVTLHLKTNKTQSQRQCPLIFL